MNCANGATNVWGQTFSFDAYGNISKSVPSGSTGGSFQPTYSDSTNQFTLAACTVTYDGNGNLTNDCANTYSWDFYGNMTSVNSTNLTYDALGREVEITAGSVHTQVLYSPLGKLGLMNGQTAKTIRIPLPGGGTAELLGATGGQTHILHSDWLGSSRLSTTYGGRAMVYDAAYSPYGENYAASGSASADLDYTGKFQDTASGLYDFLFRKYSPAQGRWLRPDPARLAAVDPNNPQSWNRYAYVLNNPLSLTDPLGLCGGGPGDNGGPCVPFAYKDESGCVVYVTYRGVTGEDGQTYDMPSFNQVCPGPPSAMTIIQYDDVHPPQDRRNFPGPTNNGLPSPPSITDIIRKSNAAFAQCVQENAIPGVSTGVAKTLSEVATNKEAPTTTDTLLNAGEAAVDVQKECLAANPLSVLDPGYQGIVLPGDPGVYPLPLPGWW